MNVHAHIVKVHMVIDANYHWARVFLSPVKFTGSGATAKSVRQSVSWRMAKCEVINLTLSDCDSDGDFIHAIEESHQSISVSSFCILYTSSFCYISQSQPDLFCIARSWKFRFAMIASVRAKLFTGSSGNTSLDLSMIGCWAYGGWLCSYTTRIAAGKLPLIVT